MEHFALTLVASVASPAMERRNDGCGSERKGSIAGEKGAAKAPRGPCVESDAYASCLQRTAAPTATRNGSELWNAGRRFLVSAAPLSAVCWHCRTFVQGARARPSVIQASTALRRNGHWTYACSAGAQARARWYLRPCLLPAADSRCNTTAMRLRATRACNPEHRPWATQRSRSRTRRRRVISPAAAAQYSPRRTHSNAPGGWGRVAMRLKNSLCERRPAPRRPGRTARARVIGRRPVRRTAMSPVERERTGAALAPPASPPVDLGSSEPLCSVT